MKTRIIPSPPPNAVKAGAQWLALALSITGTSLIVAGSLLDWRLRASR